MGKEPDLSKLAKTLTSKRLECTAEIKVLMDCMVVRHIAAAPAAAERGCSDAQSAISNKQPLTRCCLAVGEGNTAGRHYRQVTGCRRKAIITAVNV
jgi:hypothetical protein